MLVRQPVVVEAVEQRLHDVSDARAGLAPLEEPVPDLPKEAQLVRRDLRGSGAITQNKYERGGGRGRGRGSV